MRLLYALPLIAVMAAGAGWAFARQAQQPPAAAPAAPSCKAYNGAKCCEPGITAHLTRQAVYSACGQSDATYLGEKAEKNTCNYYFKVGDEPPADTYVQVFAPPTKDVPAAPNDPFFVWKKLGKVFMIDKARSPKAAAMTANSLGLWFPGKGYIVSVKASTKVCAKPTAKKLAAAIQ
jgi:hypothetical protein